MNRTTTGTVVMVVALVMMVALALTAAPDLARARDAGGADARGAANKAAVVEGDRADPAQVDWTRGLVIGRGAAAADMRAPSAEIARVRAERQARERALAAARARLDAVELAGKPLGTLKDLGSRLDRAVAQRARDLTVHYGSDGSATVTVGVPLEAVRAAVSERAGAPVTGEPAPNAPTAVVVDARRMRGRMSPVLGLRIEGGGVELAAPTVYVSDIEAARADPRLGKRPLEARAKSYARGVLTLRDGEGLDKLAAARQPLVVVVIQANRKGTRSP